jgi:hypothetical protein
MKKNQDCIEGDQKEHEEDGEEGGCEEEDEEEEEDHQDPETTVAASPNKRKKSAAERSMMPSSAGPASIMKGGSTGESKNEGNGEGTNVPEKAREVRQQVPKRLVVSQGAAGKPLYRRIRNIVCSSMLPLGRQKRLNAGSISSGCHWLPKKTSFILTEEDALKRIVRMILRDCPKMCSRAEDRESLAGRVVEIMQEITSEQEEGMQV